MSEIDPQPGQDYLSEVMEKFRARFEPAATVAEATHFYSTTEIHQALNRFNPGEKISEDAVYNLLKCEGYQWMIEDQRFRFDLKWMLRQAE